MIEVRRATLADLERWAQMRHALWNEQEVAHHREDARATYLCGNADRMALIALDESKQVVGFAEAAVRRDYVDGCDTTPVAFLEGIFVEPSGRRRGAARMLSDASASWGRERGCAEYASNALLDNVDSHAFHASIGFVETERVVFFKRRI